jgi:RNA polymerase sigma factor for flagellar operon FliA
LVGDLHGLEIGPLYRQDQEDSSDPELISIAAGQQENPFFRCLRGEISKRLAEAIEELPERERLVIILYYHEELTLSEIGRALERSETKIHQIRTSAILRLRAALSDIFMDPVFSSPAKLNSNAKKWSSSTERTGPGRTTRSRVSQAERRRVLGQVLEPWGSPC